MTLSDLRKSYFASKELQNSALRLCQAQDLAIPRWAVTTDAQKIKYIQNIARKLRKLTFTVQNPQDLSSHYAETLLKELFSSLLDLR